VKSFQQQDIDTARANLKSLGGEGDPWGRMRQKLLDDGRAPATERDPQLGYVANNILAEPGIVQRIRDEGFDAKVSGQELDANPYMRDGDYGWWREGWYAAADNMGDQ
jgi:hypothetical protein